MSKHIDDMTTNVVEETVDTIPNTVDVAIVFEDDGDYIVDNGVKSGPLEITKDGLCYILPANSANRKWFSLKKIDAVKANGVTSIVLDYRASRKIGPIGNKLPNEKLISYLPEELQVEYKAIIDRAMAARDAAKTKPMTELEKAQAKLERAQAALAKLQAEAQNGNV